MRLALDTFIWKHVGPYLTQRHFKSALVRRISMLYISLFKQPRKFLKHYLSGKGSHLEIDVLDYLGCNQLVLAALLDEVKNNIKGIIHVPQTMIYDPKWRYSIGSANISYSVAKEKISIKVEARYNFKSSTERLTKHLHYDLNSLSRNGKAKDFIIKSELKNYSLDQLAILYNKIRNFKLPETILAQTFG